ncbi:MAG: TonB-dependent receptor plug domain-containing protein [Saprospiraceae bacterium]|nr:TonB-dependent receptor plug domain-containing protein [Saprospiraceae bacterium]
MFKLLRKMQATRFAQKSFTCLFSFFLSHSIVFSQNTDSLKQVGLQEVTITATMAGDKTPMSFINIKKEQIRKNDFGQDIPFLIKNTPSVVETSDAGAGIGYTGLRVRGSDATRINITIDGVPINDAESQLVYWVNMPDLSASTSMIQIQRGVGTSTNGSGAFGATINLITNGLQNEKFVNYSGTVGSFGTVKNTIAFGTGLMRNGLSVDGRLSRITSDGYVDRASSTLGSAYLSANYVKKNTSLRFKIFTGNERTYQSWYGIPESYMTDAKLRTYNPAGTEKADSPYPNQVDDYSQTHAHLTLNHSFSKFWRINASLHYTKGKGFYEEYKAAQKLKNYFAGRTDTTDLVRRLWLDNDFYGVVWSAIFEKNKWQSTTGGGWNVYKGDHFGQVIWSEKDVTFAKTPSNFYLSQSNKSDFNIFEKINYNLNHKTSLFLDLQYRHVAYNTEGGDRKKRNINRTFEAHFFNPKLGFVVDNQRGMKFYASIAQANREPNRNDLTDAELTNLPQSESMIDGELGLKKRWKNAELSANLYYMHYKNQLVVTGSINDVGEQIRVNVPKSYRRGIEIEGAYVVAKWLEINGNASFSENKILNFTEYRDDWDTGAQQPIEHGKTDIAFSPNVVANSAAVFSILKNEKNELTVTPSVKLVGQQFIDNTSNSNTVLPAYSYTNFQILYKTEFRKVKNITVKLLINNIFDQKFANNAWTYRFNSPSYDPRPDDPYARLETGSVYNLTGYFPQAGRHWLAGLSFNF